MKITVPVVVAVMASLAAPVSLRSEETRLIDAVRGGDVRAVQALLKSGANVNERDETGATALMYAGAFGSLETVRALLDAKADVNLAANEGATTLIWAAGDSAKVRLLLDRGAAIDGKAMDGTTALVSAARKGNGDAVALLLGRGANPRASGDEGALLMQAGFVSMNPEVRRLLAGAGVVPTNFDQIVPALGRVDAMNFDVVTRFLEAGGPPNITLPHVTIEPPLLGVVVGVTDVQTVQLLLDRGADPNAAETKHHSTPLMRAAAAYRPDPMVVRLLIDRGARLDARDDAGRSALDWALTQGDTDIVKLLRSAGAQSTAPPDAAPAPAAAPLAARQSVEKAIARMDTIGPTFYSRNKCISCHNHSLPAMARTLASARGVSVAPAVAAHPDEATLSVWKAQREPFMMGQCIGYGFIGASTYGLVSMAEAHTPRNVTTDMVAACLATRQGPDGSWAVTDSRPPLSGNAILYTALAVRGLEAYTPPGLRGPLQPRLARARNFLQAAQPRDTQDAALKLLGLVWAKAPSAEIARQATHVRALQRADGGWGQWPTMAPDAYATGQALQALSVSGMSGTDPVYRRGADFLLRTQLEDGTWFVRSRGFGFQPFAESGFPHGKSQFISAAATSWAVMALSHTL